MHTGTCLHHIVHQSNVMRPFGDARHRKSTSHIGPSCLLPELVLRLGSSVQPQCPSPWKALEVARQVLADQCGLVKTPNPISHSMHGHGHQQIGPGCFHFYQTPGIHIRQKASRGEVCLVLEPCQLFLDGASMMKPRPRPVIRWHGKQTPVAKSCGRVHRSTTSLASYFDHGQ